jgi:hypothetical protein
MANTIRQGNLYGAESWSTVYASFKNAEFTSYDFDTLRNAMISYMQVNYAEEFNDYIQNSEFIALLDLVAFTGQNLAFRMDLNARENILDTAEKRESVLRIARMLSYKPKRVRPAQGLLKIVNILTTENIIDSTGTDISNKTITWGSDPSELEYERFIRVMNSAFDSTNQFGTPINRVVNSTTGNLFEIYNLNNTDNLINKSVSVIADGNNLNFDLLPVTIDTNGNIVQSIPDPDSAFSIMYKNDGKGVGSTKTGFFILAKQGYMVNKNYSLNGPEANLIIDLENTRSVSEDDFYVQTVDSLGSVLTNWTRVDTVNLANIVVNNYGVTNKNLYEVLYSDADITSIKFGDGGFANAPTGNLKVWYRIAEDRYVRVKAGEINSLQFVINYKNSQNQSFLLQMTLELQDNMTTGIPSETINEIKNNAPETFYSKNRMVTGDDYNGLMATLNNDVLLIKSKNRTFSGHTRYVDLNDPTGKSRPLIELGDDGYLYSQSSVKNTFVPDSGIRRNVDFVSQFIETELSNLELLNFYYGNLDLKHTGNSKLFPVIQAGVNDIFNWQVAYNDNVSSNGYIYATDPNNTKLPQRLGFNSTGFLRYIRPNAMVKIYDNSSYQWIIISDVKGDGTGVDNLNGSASGKLSNGNGTVEINKSITTNDQIKEIIPPFPRIFDDTTNAAIIAALDLKKDFSLAFNNTGPSWTINIGGNLDEPYDSSKTVNNWIINLTRNNNGWTISSRQLDFVFGSENLIRFYNINFLPSFNVNFREVSNDYIHILVPTTDATTNITTITNQQSYRIVGYYVYNDGYTDNSKVKVTPLNLNNDFLPTDPESFNKIVQNSTINLINYVEGEFEYLIPQSIDSTAIVQQTQNGKSNILFKWEHNVTTDQSLNPSLTNIIDCYVLTKTYNDEFIQWRASGASAAYKPLPPTSEDLYTSFVNLTNYKMLTDEVVFHPAQYMPLFGNTADEQFQATFAVVKNINSKLTDNELKTKIITAIDKFFTPGNFTFGEIFYFTELAAYVHSTLKNDLNSIVLVPVNQNSKFGSLFQIIPDTDNIVTSVATVNNVEIITELTNVNIRMI